MLKAVLFDMDGVIIDSEPMHFEVDKNMMRQFGIEIQDEELYRYVGVDNRSMLIDIKKLYSLEQSIEELLNIQSELKIKALKEYDKDAIPGVRELLKELKHKNILTAVASSSPVSYIDIVIDKFDIRKFFDVYVSADEVGKGKPAPDVFLKTAELLKVRPDECVVIEDSENGVLAASAAGMKCIAYKNKNSGIQDLRKADIVVNSLFDISIDLLESIFIQSEYKNDHCIDSVIFAKE